MTTGETTHPDAETPANGAGHGVYVYGIVRAGTSLPNALPSVGDEQSGVRLVSHGNLAAVVSDFALTRPLGARGDLLAHERVLDVLAAETSVLPMRFGAVLDRTEAVSGELLSPQREHFEAVLAELEGLVQFSVRGRYADDVHLREIVTEEPSVRQLREELQGVPEDAGYDLRIRMGELVNDAVLRKRTADSEVLTASVAPTVVASVPHEVSGADSAVHAAFLVERGRVAEFEHAVDQVGRRWEGRIHLRQLGPLAPYDFLPESREWD